MPERIDTLGMWAVTLGFGDQLEAALAKVASRIPGLPSPGAVDQVVVVGMGGSGITGDVLVALAEPVSPVPVMTVKDSTVPAFVGPSTLVLAISFSGNSAETLAATRTALERGAPVVTIAAGGALPELVGADAVRLGVDPSIPMPRAALGALLAPVLAVAEDVGVLPGARRQGQAAVEQLRRRAKSLGGSSSDAAHIARVVGRTWPLVYGSGRLGAVAALRWKNQVNENAKAPAFAHALPEVCHNELCGWGQHGDVTRQLITLVELRHAYETPEIGRRFELVNDQMLEIVSEVVTVEAAGDGPLAQLLDLVLVGDVVTLHMAEDAGVDPGPIPALDLIKAGLSTPRALPQNGTRYRS